MMWGNIYKPVQRALVCEALQWIEIWEEEFVWEVVEEVEVVEEEVEEVEVVKVVEVVSEDKEQ